MFFNTNITTLFSRIFLCFFSHNRVITDSITYRIEVSHYYYTSRICTWELHSIAADHCSSFSESSVRAEEEEEEEEEEILLDGFIQEAVESGVTGGRVPSFPALNTKQSSSL